MKKTLALLLLTALLITPLSGCNKSSENKNDGIATTDNIPAYNAADANPASDFEYKVGEDGGITITKYIGTDSDVVLPEQIDGKDVTVIGEGAFQKNLTLRSIAMSSTVSIIELSAFESCAQLVAVVLSDNLIKIYDNVFMDCIALSHIKFPDSLTHIGSRAFMNCKSLTHISIPANCFNVIDGGAFRFSTLTFAGAGLETVEICDGVDFIPQWAFQNTKIKEIRLPRSVIEIQSGAFAGCTELETVVLNEGIRSIWDSAFRNTQIKEISFPKTVQNLLISAFDGDDALTKMYFEGNVPNNFIVSANQGVNSSFTIYYHEGAEGFTSPEWNGYKTEIW